jgi:hypothetical protein
MVPDRMSTPASRSAATRGERKVRRLGDEFFDDVDRARDIALPNALLRGVQARSGVRGIGVGHLFQGAPALFTQVEWSTR